jgi:hypothetical protein
MRFRIALAVGLWSTMTLAQTTMWVGSDTLNRRTCGSEQCGIVGRLFHREQVTVLEQAGGWVRITGYYDARCVGGISKFVDKGAAECTPENGITDGRFAEWVSEDFLVAERPPDPGAGAEGTAKLISGSDDLRQHREAFIRAAENLMQSGQCTAQDFINEGGWIKAVTGANRDRPVYFTYCKGGQDRVYLDAGDGRIFR